MSRSVTWQGFDLRGTFSNCFRRFFEEPFFLWFCVGPLQLLHVSVVGIGGVTCCGGGDAKYCKKFLLVLNYCEHTLCAKPPSGYPEQCVLVHATLKHAILLRVTDIEHVSKDIV